MTTDEARQLADEVEPDDPSDDFYIDLLVTAARVLREQADEIDRLRLIVSGLTAATTALIDEADR